MNKNKIDILDEQVLDILEDNIKNYNSLDDKSKVLHTVPIQKIFYVSYQLKPYLSKETLIDNTISKYLSTLEEQKETYLQNNDNELYADIRYKNYLTQDQIDTIKFQFLHKYKLCEVDIVINIKNPYFEYLYALLHTFNAYSYIVKVQFTNQATQYKYATYEKKLDNKIEESNNKFKSLEASEARLHKGLITNYKNDNIEGSLLISMLNKGDLLNTLLDTDLSPKDKIMLEENQFFNKSFYNINFTQKELLDGYLQRNFSNYAYLNYELYKTNRLETNQQIKSSMSMMTHHLITKEMINTNIRDIFKQMFKTEVPNKIRIDSTLQVLRYYDGYPIYAHSRIDKLEHDFFEFVNKTIFDKRETIKNFVNENFDEAYKTTCQIRPHFY